MSVHFEPGFWLAVGWTMIHMVWIGGIIGAMALVVRRLLRSARPETRYAVALMFLLAMAIAPGCAYLASHPVEPRDEVIYGGVPKIYVTPATATTPERIGVDFEIQEIKRPREVDAKVRPQNETVPGWWSRLDGVAAWLPWLWLIGSSTTLGMLVLGVAGVERLRRSSRIVTEGALADRCRVLAGSLGMTRRVGVAICDRIAGPLLIGVVRPLILLPPAAISGWSVDQLEMVLLHELAHLRRWDNLVNLAQRVVEALLFFHPVAWWLSGWVRLERELCCDHLVVNRMKQPVAYASLLAELAGAGRLERGAALAMANRQVMTRIRWILEIKERSMKLTMPEGFGLLGALVLGATLLVGSHAAPPISSEKDADESTRQALRKIVAEAKEFKASGSNETDEHVMTLANIAEAQFKLGDAEGGKQTLNQALAKLEGEITRPESWEALMSLLMLNDARVRNVEPEEDRKLLDRITKFVDTIKLPAPGEPVAQVGFNPEAPQRANAQDEETETFLMILSSLAERRLAFGEKAEARRLLNRAIALCQSSSPIENLLFRFFIAPSLHKAGDITQARALLENKLPEIQKLPETEREIGSRLLAMAFFQMGSSDEALKVLCANEPKNRTRVVINLLDGLGYGEYDNAWLDPAGLKILIGAHQRKIKDQDLAHRCLPPLAQFVQTLDDSPGKAQALAMIAHYQAIHGDPAAAMAVADSIPSLKRSDFSGPNEGFYDSVKPVTYVKIAQCELKAGRRDVAAQALDRAMKLCEAIVTPGERTVAEIMILDALIACGRDEDARVLVKQAVPRALALTEPRRSRSLAVLVASQAKLGDFDDARKTIDAIRDYPGLEKMRGLHHLANAYEKRGDEARMKAALREELAAAGTKKPEEYGKGPMIKTNAFGATTYIDPDADFHPAIAEHFCQMSLAHVHARLGDLDGAKRLIEAQPAPNRPGATNALVSSLVSMGKVDQALELVRTMDSFENRLSAMQMLACMIRDRDRETLKAR